MLLLEEVARDDPAVPLGEQLDGVVEVAEELLGLERLGRLGRRAVGEHVAEGELLATVAVADAVLERQDHGAEHAVADGGELGGLHAHGGGDVGRRRRAAALVGEILLGEVERPPDRSHRAGGPVGGAYGVEDGAADPPGGEAVEGHASGAVVALGRLDQAEGTGPGQLLAVDVAGEVAGDLEDHVVHEGQVALDQQGGLGT